MWFHVDKLSSAHVYLRLNKVGETSSDNCRENSFLFWRYVQGQGIDDVPASVIEDAAQLVKANSITGNKTNNIDVVYTMWSNLKKTAGMEVGQVGFYREKEVRLIPSQDCS